MLAAGPAGDFPISGFPPALDTSLDMSAPRAGGNERHFRAWSTLEIVPVRDRGVGG